eukprot:5735133-Amphidinium_carterae.1
MSPNGDLKPDQYGAMRSNTSRTASPRPSYGLPGAPSTGDQQPPSQSLVEMAHAMIVTIQTSADGVRAETYEMRQVTQVVQSRRPVAKCSKNTFKVFLVQSRLLVATALYERVDMSSLM